MGTRQHQLGNQQQTGGNGKKNICFLFECKYNRVYIWFGLVYDVGCTEICMFDRIKL